VKCTGDDGPDRHDAVFDVPDHEAECEKDDRGDGPG